MVSAAVWLDDVIVVCLCAAVQRTMCGVSGCVAG